jgi:tRNA uridine 5-carboxymethylaminomethyl modification enzyme
MIDDLVTKGCRVILDAPDSDRGGPAGASAQAADEPYRLMTSLAEWRLNLRWDNADLRLMDHGRRVGLLSENLYDRFLEYRRRVSAAVRAALPEAAAEAAYPFPGARSSSGERPDAPSAGPAAAPDGDSDGPAWDEAAINRQVTVERQYWGYMKRQRQEILKARKLEDRRIPDDADYDSMAGLLTEARQKLKSVRPVSIGQAARIPGVNPSDVSILLVHLERRRRTAEAAPRA